jgi:hypothetical protein
MTAARIPADRAILCADGRWDGASADKDVLNACRRSTAAAVMVLRVIEPLTTGGTPSQPGRRANAQRC